MPPPRPRAPPNVNGDMPLSMHAWYGLRDELLDRIDNVEDLLTNVNRRVDATQDRLEDIGLSAQRASDSQVATVSDVRALVASTINLDARFESFEASLKALRTRDGTDVTNVLRVTEKRVTQRVLEALHNESSRNTESSLQSLMQEFRSEIASLSNTAETRHAETTAHIRKIELNIQNATSQVTALDNRVRNLEKELREANSAMNEIKLSMREIEGDAKISLESAKIEMRDIIRQEVYQVSTSIRQELQQAMSTLRQEVFATLATFDSKLADFTGNDHVWHRVDSVVARARTEIERSSDAISERLLNRCAALEERQQSSIRGLESVCNRVGTLQTSLDELSSLTQKVDDGLSSVRREHRDAVTGLEAVVQQQTIEIGHMKDDFAHHADESSRNLSLVREQLAAHETSAKGQNRRIDDELDHLRRAIENSLEQRVQTMSSDIAALQQELDMRHRKLVDSTHSALERLAVAGAEAPLSIASVKQEIMQLKETAQLHATAIERWRVDGAALAEIRDWLQDLERRAASRSEVEQIISGLSASVAANREAAENAEAILSQRIEGERSAREYESTSLRSMIQRSTARIASP